MERVLLDNAEDKGDSWKGMDNLELLGFLEDNAQELILASTLAGPDPAILRRAVNVANYAMMVAANNGMLATDLGAACWLCGVADGACMTTITTQRDSPNGPQCDPKDVPVHPGCYQDMEP